MTVSLRVTKPAEFDQYLEHAIKNFADKKIKSGIWKQRQAINKSEEEHRQLLPNGLSTDNHYFYTICKGDMAVGMVWLAKKSDHNGFIYDINILKKHQGKGYGKLAMKQIEMLARESGLNVIELHVFGHNQVARRLYEQLGYIETNIKMKKGYKPTLCQN